MDGRVRRAAGRSAGPGLPHLHLCDDPSVRAGGGGEARQVGLGAGPAQSSGAAGRGDDAEARLGKLRRGRADADAPRHDDGRTGPVVHRPVQAGCGLPGGGDAGLGAGGWAGLRLAAAGPVMGQSQPECAEPVDGARLCGHGDAGRGDLVGGAGDDTAIGAVRGAGHRRARGHRGNAGAGAGMAGRLRLARHVVRADLPQARRKAVQRGADPRRSPRL